MTRIFMTGGTGFFGKSILDSLKRRPSFLAGTSWTILSRDPDRFAAAHADLLGAGRDVSFVRGDVRDFRADGRYDAIVHAATAAVTTLSDDEMLSTIVDGTRHVVDVARACGAKRILYVSSGAVYGPRTSPADEDALLAPATAYGRGKLEAERILAASRLDAPVARCFAFVGPYLPRGIHYAIGNFIRDALAGGPIVVRGDGTPLRSYLDADDLVDWLFAILARGVGGRAYNVGSPEGLSIREVAERVRAALAPACEVRVEGTPEAGARPSVYVPVTARAARELGLGVTVKLEDAIRRAAGRQ